MSGPAVRAKLRAALKPEATVLIEVRADDPAGRLDGVLARFAAALDGPKYVSAPVPVPGGRVMLIDLGDTPPALLRAVPDRLIDGLAEAGFTDAVVTVPQRIGHRYAAVTSLGPAARAFFAGRPGTGGDLLHHGLGRLRATGAEPIGVVISAEVPLTWDSAEEVCTAVLAAGSTACVVASDFSAEAAVLAVDPGPPPYGSLTIAGETAARMRELRDLLLARPELLVWAGVSAEPDAAWMWSPQWADRPVPGEQRAPGAAFLPVVADEIAGDGLWFQVLSPGHLARLGGPPPGSVPLPGGRVAVTVGEPEQWLPGHPDRTVVQREARALLAGCLVPQATAVELARSRRAQG